MTKGWTEERRQKARERILKNKPWEKSTGPKSKAGKDASAMNALKHGDYSQVLVNYNHLFKIHEFFLKQLQQTVEVDERCLAAIDRLQAKNKLIENHEKPEA